MKLLTKEWWDNVTSVTLILVVAAWGTAWAFAGRTQDKIQKELSENNRGTWRFTVRDTDGSMLAAYELHAPKTDCIVVTKAASGHVAISCEWE